MNENTLAYIKRYVPRNKMQEAYDNCMYTLDLQSVDNSIDNEGSNEIEPISSCKNIVGDYYCSMQRIVFFSGENEHFFSEHQNEMIDQIIHKYIPLFNDIVTNTKSEYRENGNDLSMSDYISLIKWPLVRLNNSFYLNYHQKTTYCNMLFRRTSEYLAYYIERKSKMWNFIDKLLYGMNANLEKDSILRDLIESYSASRCVAVAKIDYKNGTDEWKIAFSGFWDNAIIAKNFNTKSLEHEFSEVYYNVITNYRFRNIVVRNMIWCKVDYNIISYDIKPIEPLPHKLYEFKKLTVRKGCCKKHYSCCERKILADTNKLSNIRRIQFFVTYEPCNDCRSAINHINSSYRSDFISVISRKPYISKGHCCNF